MIEAVSDGFRRAMAPALRIAAQAAMLLAATGCGPPLEATAPLSAGATALVDERLIGTWYVARVDKPIPPSLLIGRTYEEGEPLNVPPTSLNVMYFDGEAYKMHSYHLLAHPSRIDGETYYNLRRTPDLPNLDYTAPGETPGYMILRVFFLTDDLFAACTLGLHDDSPLRSMVALFGEFGAEARIVRGVPRFGTQRYEEPYQLLRPTHGSKWDYVVLDVTSEQLADLIRRNRPNRLFYHLGVFARFGSTTAGADFAELKSNNEAGIPAEVRDACLVD